ncbi:MAG: hormogonium polysaccharide biosynthesis glycosyltransferase HpsE, partial [Cyanobacteria bacterium P01_H01_bin.130]
MPRHLTVAIPTYNGAERLPLVLDRLKHQQHLDQIDWEVLVIDNNSTDATAIVVKTHQEHWQQHFKETGRATPVPLRYLTEPRQGAAYGRQKAVEMAEGEWIAFLDDDNIPASDWLFQALTFIDQNDSNETSLGAISGQIHGVFPDENFPELIRYIRPFLAIVERGDRPFLYDIKNKLLPPSAGLIVRRDAWQRSVPKKLLLGGRTADCMLTSEDLETLVYLQRQDWTIWYNPAMEIDHLIPQRRLEREYLIPFLKGIGLTRSIIRMLRLPLWQRPLWTILYALNDTSRLLKHLLQSRKQRHNQLLADCKTVFLQSTLISPLFMMTWRLRQRSAVRVNP